MSNPSQKELVKAINKLLDIINPSDENKQDIMEINIVLFNNFVWKQILSKLPENMTHLKLESSDVMPSGRTEWEEGEKLYTKQDFLDFWLKSNSSKIEKDRLGKKKRIADEKKLEAELERIEEELREEEEFESGDPQPSMLGPQAPQPSMLGPQAPQPSMMPHPSMMSQPSMMYSQPPHPSIMPQPSMMSPQPSMMPPHPSIMPPQPGMLAASHPSMMPAPQPSMMPAPQPASPARIYPNLNNT